MKSKSIAQKLALAFIVSAVLQSIVMWAVLVAGRVIHKKNDPDFAMEFRLSDKEIKIVSEGGLLNYIEKYNSLDI